jgi:hypothetical protein
MNSNTTLQTPLLVAKDEPLVPGKLYLRLYHGRTDPEQQMEDWGFTGPTFGPSPAMCIPTAAPSA